MKILFSALQKCIEALLRIANDGCLILMFHQVNDDRAAWEKDEFAVSRKGFVALMERLSSHGYDFISPEQLDHFTRKTRKVVCVTFDDAYRDVYSNVYPYMKLHSIPFSLFMTVNLIGHPGFLSEGELRELASDPLCTIGSHSYSHPALRSHKKNYLYHEVVESGGMLEKIVGKKIKYFAYPYGSIHAVSAAAIFLAKRHYSIAFSTLRARGRVPSCFDHFFPRLNINESNVDCLRI